MIKYVLICQINTRGEFTWEAWQENPPGYLLDHWHALTGIDSPFADSKWYVVEMDV